MTIKIPVYSLNAFQDKEGKLNFYSNLLKPHVREHQFTHLPHKHDFYLTILITAGSGWHEVDFVKYKVKARQVFTMQPGQMHSWQFSKNIDGFVFFHSKEFFDEGYIYSKIKDFPFFKSFQSNPCLLISKSRTEQLTYWMNEILLESKNLKANQLQKIHALIQMVYIELSREYSGHLEIKNSLYLNKLQQFEDLLELHFKELKYARDYASKLNITEKHLNRIVKTCINKTSTELITDRLVLEAKRMLIQSELTVTQIAEELGYADKSYFARVFKKQTNETALGFLRKYKAHSG